MKTYYFLDLLKDQKYLWNQGDLSSSKHYCSQDTRMRSKKTRFSLCHNMQWLVNVFHCIGLFIESQIGGGEGFVCGGSRNSRDSCKIYDTGWVSCMNQGCPWMVRLSDILIWRDIYLYELPTFMLVFPLGIKILDGCL